MKLVLKGIEITTCGKAEPEYMYVCNHGAVILDTKQCGLLSVCEKCDSRYVCASTIYEDREINISWLE